MMLSLISNRVSSLSGEFKLSVSTILHNLAESPSAFNLKRIRGHPHESGDIYQFSIKKGAYTYRMIQYKPRIDANLLYQQRRHILLRKKQWGPPKSILTVAVPALVPGDTDEYRQITPYLNHRPADCSYRRNQ